MSTLLRARTFKYGLIFLTWAAAVACIVIVDEVPFKWRPVVWPFTALLSFLKIPGIALLVAAGAGHGIGMHWIDLPIMIFVSAIFWFLVTIILMALWCAIRRR